MTTRLVAESKSRDKKRKSSRSKPKTAVGSKDATLQHSYNGYLNFRKRETPASGEEKRPDKIKHRPTSSLIPVSDLQSRIPAQVKNSLIISRDLSMVWRDKATNDLSKVERTTTIGPARTAQTISPDESNHPLRSAIPTNDISLVKARAESSYRNDFLQFNGLESSSLDLHSRILLQSVQAHRNSITGLATADNGYLVSTSLDHSLKVWSYYGSLLNRNPLYTLKDSSQLTALAASSGLVAACNRDGFVKVWPLLHRSTEPQPWNRCCASDCTKLASSKQG